MAVQKSRKTPSKRGMHRSHSGARGTRGVDRRRRAVRLIRDIAFPAMVFIAAARCCRPRRMRQRPKNKPSTLAAARRRPIAHRVCAAPYCHRRHERRSRTVGFRSGGAGGGA